ncbi:MAG: hypothetical protein ACREM1_17250 [Longimicrobiales bacterium]
MTDQQRRRDAGDDLRDGVRTIVGVAGALKDAIEGTFQELLDRGELSPERAREAARSTVKKAQETVDQMRDRLDLVPRREFDALRDEVAALKRALEEHRTQASSSAHDEGAASRAADTPPSESPGGAGRTNPGFTVDER